MEISKESSFNTLLDEEDGPPNPEDLIDFDDDLMEFIYGDAVYEGNGQCVNSLGIVPCGSVLVCNTDPWDLQTENSQLRFQINKLSDECSDLRQQNSTYQDENLLLLSQKEELERKLANRDLVQERIRQQQKELNEARQTIANTDDLNAVLSARIIRLEKHYFDIEAQDKDLKRDFDTATNELEKCLIKLKQKEEEIEHLKSGSEDVVQQWLAKEKWMEHRVTDLDEANEELTRTVNQLRREKLELEINLVDITGNQLAQLNSSPDENSSTSSSPGSPPPPITPRSFLRRSLQAEIAATIERKRIQFQPDPSCPSPRERCSVETELVDATTQSDESADEGFSNGERHRVTAKEMAQLINILEVVKGIRELVLEQGRSEKEEEVVGSSTTGNGNGSFIEGKRDEPVVPDSVLAGDDTDTTRDEMIRRVNQELAEFRQQLKKSQEMFHTMQNNGSASAVSLGNVTQSCPILADSNSTVPAKPQLVCCSTQTEAFVIDQHSRRSSTQQDGPIRSLLDAIDDMDNEGDGNYLDKLSDDISYRLTINLPTVLEESEEIETSPAGPRRMSLDKGRRRLVRMQNATEEEYESNNHREEEEEAFKSDSEYRSAASSLHGSLNSGAFNSLERPLQITGAYGSHRNGDPDSVSLVSDGNTTFGSPLSSPSSPTYWTPLENFSSQETITNNDGDKTPVNEGNGLHKYDDYEVLSCPIPSKRTEYENGTGSLPKRGSSWGPSLPTYNKNATSSIGVIPEADREHMIKYAYDPVGRNSEIYARFLDNAEWRTLRKDLDKKDQESFRKRTAQDEGNDIEGGMALESGLQKPSFSPDLEEEAEEYLESFPDLVEQLFTHLDTLKRSQNCPSDCDLETISKRFNHLALTFRTEHTNLTKRKDSKLSEHDSSKTKMQGLIRALSGHVQEFEEVTKTHKVPEEVNQIFGSLKHIPGDLDIYTSNLSKTSRRVGMMDVQVRLYKMIEVMVLYVHILRNLCGEKEKDLESARKLLAKHNIPFPTTNTVAKMNNNNNNNDKVSWDEGQLDEGDSKRDHDGHILQRLLGPKKSSVGLDYKMKEKLVLREKKSSTNVFIRYLSDAYETLRCELFWPWTWEETWKGTKQGFSIILMIVGLFIIIRSLFPIVSADDPPPVSDLSSIFSKHGNLNHAKLPPV